MTACVAPVLALTNSKLTCDLSIGDYHKVRIYAEYHSVCHLVGIGTLQTPFSPASVPLPPEPEGGGTLACG
jgi:hypothetical protein